LQNGFGHQHQAATPNHSLETHSRVDDIQVLLFRVHTDMGYVSKGRSGAWAISIATRVHFSSDDGDVTLRGDLLDGTLAARAVDHASNI
jgi:hypothetical protein